MAIHWKLRAFLEAAAICAVVCGIIWIVTGVASVIAAILPGDVNSDIVFFVLMVPWFAWIWWPKIIKADK